MFSIIASGLKENQRMIVSCGECEWVFFFNSHKDSRLEHQIYGELKKRHPIAGSYVPPEDSPLNLKNVIEFHFFDKKVDSIEVNGDIGELPYEEGFVY